MTESIANCPFWVFPTLAAVVIALYNLLVMSRIRPIGYLHFFPRDHWISGKDLRERIMESLPGYLSEPRFYGMMSELKESHLVESKGTRTIERTDVLYRLTGQGIVQTTMPNS